MSYRSRQIENLERALLRVLTEAPTKAIEISGLICFSPPPRTFAVAVHSLIKRGLIVQEGSGKATTYRLAPHSPED